MANPLTVEHVSDGEHVQLTTLSVPVSAVAMKLGERRFLAVQAPEGTNLEVKTSTGTMQLVTIASPREGWSVLASSSLGDGQGVQLETPMGALAARGFGVWHPEAGEELAGDEFRDLPPPTQP